MKKPEKVDFLLQNEMNKQVLCGSVKVNIAAILDFGKKIFPNYYLLGQFLNNHHF